MAADDDYLQNKLDILETKMSNKQITDGSILRQVIDCVQDLKKIKALSVEIKSKTTIDIIPYIKIYLDM